MAGVRPRPTRALVAVLHVSWADDELLRYCTQRGDHTKFLAPRLDCARHVHDVQCEAAT